MHRPWASGKGIAESGRHSLSKKPPSCSPHSSAGVPVSPHAHRPLLPTDGLILSLRRAGRGVTLPGGGFKLGRARTAQSCLSWSVILRPGCRQHQRGDCPHRGPAPSRCLTSGAREFAFLISSPAQRNSRDRYLEQLCSEVPENWHGQDTLREVMDKHAMVHPDGGILFANKMR